MTPSRPGDGSPAGSGGDRRELDQAMPAAPENHPPLPGRVVCWSYDHVVLPLPPRHRYPRHRFRLVRERLVAEGTLSPDRVRRAEPEDWELLALVHEPGYLNALRQDTLSKAAKREIGLPFSPGLVERARTAVHGTVQAALSALRHGAAGNLGGGTHHAYADRASGYCVLNDIAVAARYVQHQRLAGRIAIVDLDVHQGNGNAAIFAGDASVFTLSVHGASNWPYRKERSDRDVALPDGTDDAAYLAAVEGPLTEIFGRFAPDLVFYQAGADPLAADRLGRLALTREGLRRRDGRVFALCREHGVPVVVTLGGGYGVPIEETVEVHANTYRELARSLAPAPAEVPDETARRSPAANGRTVPAPGADAHG